MRAFASTTRPALAAALSACLLLAAPAAAAPPANDAFDTPQYTSGPAVTMSATTAEATGEPGEPDHAGASVPLQSVWFTWTPPTPMADTVSVDTCTADFDTTVAVYEGGSLATLTPVASNDDACGERSRVTFTPTYGTAYRIAVDGAGAAHGSFTLRLRNPALPANDDFADAKVLPGAFGADTIAGTTRGATGEPGEPDHAGESLPLQSVWYRWTAPADGDVWIDTCDATFDTTLAVYTGAAVGALTEVAASDDADGCGTGSALAGPVDAGVTYWIAVDGYGYEEGDFELGFEADPVDTPAPPAPPAVIPPARPPVMRPPATVRSQRDTTAPMAGLTIPRQRLSDAIRRGVALSVRTSEAGQACATLSLTLKAARQAGVRMTAAERRHRRVMIGKGCVSFTAAGTQTLTVRLNARAVRAFRRLARAHRKAVVSVYLVVKDTTGHGRTLNRSLVLSR